MDVLLIYKRDLSRIVVPPTAELNRLALRAAEGDLQARNSCVEFTLPMVLTVVDRFRVGSRKMDVIQEGNASIFGAIESYPRAPDVAFKTHAAHHIRSAIIRFLATDRLVRAPVTVTHQGTKEDRAAYLEKLPTISRAACSAPVLSIHVRDHYDRNGARTAADSLRDSITDPAAHAELWDEIHAMNVAMRFLDDRQQRVLRRRSVGFLMREIAADEGISVDRISQIERAALKRIRQRLGIDDVEGSIADYEQRGQRPDCPAHIYTDRRKAV